MYTQLFNQEPWRLPSFLLLFFWHRLFNSPTHPVDSTLKYILNQLVLQQGDGSTTDYDKNTDGVNKTIYKIDPSYNEMELLNCLKIPLKDSCEYYTLSWNAYSYL